MSNLVPNPQDPQDGSSLYFRQIIDRQKQSLDSITDLDEYKQRLEIIKIAIDLSSQMAESERKAVQETIDLEIARIELSDRRTRSRELQFQTAFRVIAIPLFIGSGIYIWYSSDSILGSALVFLGLRLALPKEDALNSIKNIKDLFSK